MAMSKETSCKSNGREIYTKVTIPTFLLEDRCLDNAKTVLSRSPLHVAVIEQQIETVANLISQGNYVDLKDVDGKTPLEFALISRNLQVVKLLLDAGAKVSESIMLKAVESQNFDILKMFVDKFKDSDHLEEEDDDYNNIFKQKGFNEIRTFLDLVVRFGNSSMVKMLLESDPTGSVIKPNKLLWSAVQTRNLNMVKLLLDAGADVNVKNKFSNSPLHLALDPENLDILRLLLDFKANANVKNLKDSTPMHLAIKLYGRLSDCTNLIKRLLEAGADVNAVDNEDQSPLHTAIELDCKNIVKLLLDAGAKVDNKNVCITDSSLHPTIESQNENIVKQLMDAGVISNAEEIKLQTDLLHKAVALENENIVKLLLDAGVVVKVKNKDKNTPLHIAAQKSNQNIFRLLINFGSAVNARNKVMKTPLHIAVEASNDYASKMLLEAGARVNITDQFGCTPLRLAARSGTINGIKMLIDAGAELHSWSLSQGLPLETFLLRSKDMIQKDLTEGLKLFLEHSDVNLVNTHRKNILADILESDYYAKNRNLFYKYILEHVAKVKVLNQEVNSSLLDIITRNRNYNDYFNKCINELENAKSTKLHNCHISFFNLLVDDESKFIKYAGNEDLVKDSKNSVKKFPIYGSTIESNMSYGIEGRKLFDGSADVLSYLLPILNPTHLIIRNTLDALNLEDWKKLCEKKRAREE